MGWSPGESDTIEIKLDWLTVKFPRSRRKFRFVAEYNARSANREIEVIMKKHIDEFEKKHGKITFE